MKMEPKILQRVRMIEEKNGIHYAKTDGKLYKGLRVCYSLVFFYTLFIHLLYIIGMFLTYGKTDQMKNVAAPLITVLVCTAFIIVGYVLSFFRWKLVACMVSVLPEILLIFTFGNILQDSLGFIGYKPSFYWRHFVPLLLLILLMSWLTLLALRAKYKTETQYKHVLENLYEIYHAKSAAELSEEEWKDFLNSYDPCNYRALWKRNIEE